jgi:two-component system, OmpR family, phosphate regulon sensor histidine kinase PhoR
MHSAWWQALLLVAFVVALFMTMSALARRRRARELTSLVATIDSLAAGRWDDARLDSASTETTEIRHLRRTLDKLADVVASRIDVLEDESANLKLLVDALPDPILLSDDRDRVVLINAPAERLLRLPPQQVIGKPFVAAVNDQAILELFEHASRQRAANAAGTIDREIRLMRAGKRLVFQAHAEPTRTGGMLVVLRDVSTLAATIQMKADFVANASHELRTPISAIKAAFETLVEVHRDADAAPGKRCMAIIDGHLSRLEEMLRDLLDLSRVENADLQPQFGPIRPTELMAMIRSTWSAAAREKSVELALADGDGTPSQIVSDRRLLELVLKNLVENAIKFTPAGGTVSVTLAMRPKDGQSDIELKVTDTGCGIPNEHLARVFERFYQVDPARSGSAGRGTGLGLAIVKHATNALGGTVTIESEVGRGTTITCVLPQPQSST